jgi:nucleotide-binding universal stress UspA family protein
MTPFLDLRHIDIDPNLAQHLPLGLARYYEALPVAREGDSVTVAMSHPENVTALAVLTQLFRADIVPIRTDGAAVRSALQQLYAREPAQPHGILAWLPQATQAAWLAHVQACGLASRDVTNAESAMTWLDAEQMDADTLLAAAHGGNYQLTLCALPKNGAPENPENEVQAALLREIHAPLWLVPGAPVTPRRVLLVLRGFASDEVALSWVMRLATRIEGASVSLLPIIGQAPWGALSYLRQPGPAQGHIATCAKRLEAAGIATTLTLQSGEPRHQVAQAMRQSSYDLMVVAAEGHGQFVGQLLVDL